MFGEDGFSFFDLLDIINPLQHIPIVSTIYRNQTGDKIDPGAKIAGGTLYGGSVGAVASLMDVVIELSTGEDAGSHTIRFLDTANKRGVAAIPEKQSFSQNDGVNQARTNKNKSSLLGKTTETQQLIKWPKHPDPSVKTPALNKLFYIERSDYVLENSKNQSLVVAQKYQNNVHELTKAHLIKMRALKEA